MEVPDRAPYAAAQQCISWARRYRAYLEGRVRLAGGDPEQLSLGDAANLGFNLLVEIWRGTGLDLFGALEKVEQDLGMSEAPVLDPAGNPLPSDADNERAMAELTGMIAKFGGAIR